MRLSEVTFDTTISPGVLEPVDLVNRPNSSNNKNLLLEAIRLFQRNDPESSQAAVKIVRETIRDPTDDGDENKWNRVSFFFLIFAPPVRLSRVRLRRQIYFYTL